MVADAKRVNVSTCRPKPQIGQAGIETASPTPLLRNSPEYVTASHSLAKQSPLYESMIASPGKERRVRNDSFFQQEGRPGYRNRPNRSGLDPVDTSPGFHWLQASCFW
jgi:hypothetical protein